MLRELLCILEKQNFRQFLAMSEWRFANPQGGIDLDDGVFRLLDVRFADDVLIFANTREEVQDILDSLMRHLAAGAEQFKDRGVNNRSTTTFLTFNFRMATRLKDLVIPAWLHAVRLPWSGLRCGTSFTTGGEGYRWMLYTMQGLFYQTSAAVFRSSYFFNSLLRCRTPTIIYTENI